MGNTSSKSTASQRRPSHKHKKPLKENPPTRSPTQRTIDGRIYHAVDGSQYLLPRDDQEVDRLHETHFLTKELLGCNVMADAIKTLDFQGGGLQILDVCCGPATWLCETSLDYPSCQFVGIDMCSIWPQVIRPANLEFIEANVLRGLPFPDKAFDFVQLRFVSLAFKTNEWDYILTEIRRVLRDGGVLQCIDLDMQIISDDQDIKRYLQHFDALCNTRGLDPSAGAKLDMMLNDHGLNILQSEYREIPLGWGGPLGDGFMNIFSAEVQGLAPWMKRSSNLNDEQLIAMLRRTLRGMIQSKAYMGLYAFLAQKPFDD
ncbi:S-adenosyl-L-methionine-dependent methyltransferase [Absidia repens]|uniref:S-adenosyl-L-methionine-dependent methyltransferase n=1 Tax=Absidia repens TaxID=90262 RepID=A0A1X2IVZ4_9FUNG|nr:S-adenosyl-L-methionine-dependent methyltransferase [Absidia repens]